LQKLYSQSSIVYTIAHTQFVMSFAEHDSDDRTTYLEKCIDDDNTHATRERVEWGVHSSSFGNGPAMTFLMNAA